MTLANLAALKHAQGKLEEAERLYRRALEIKLIRLGPNHPSVANTLNNIAVLAMARGECAEARSLFERTLTILEPALGSSHPNVITCTAAGAGQNIVEPMTVSTIRSRIQRRRRLS